MKIPDLPLKHKIEKNELKSNPYLKFMHVLTHEDRDESLQHKNFDWIITPKEYSDSDHYSGLYADWSRMSDSMFWLITPQESNQDNKEINEESFLNTLRNYLPDHYMNLNKYWNQIILSMLIKPIAASQKSDKKIYITKSLEEKIYFYVEKNALYCSVVGKIRFVSTDYTVSSFDYNDTDLYIPGHIHMVCKLGDYGFELQYYETTNTALKDLVLGYPFKEEMIAQAAAEEKDHDTETALNKTINNGNQAKIFQSLKQQYDNDVNTTTTSQTAETSVKIHETNIYPSKIVSFNQYEQLIRQMSHSKQKTSKIAFGSTLSVLGVLAVLIGVGLFLTSASIIPLGLPILASTSAFVLGSEAIIAGLGIIAGGVLLRKSGKKNDSHKPPSLFSSQPHSCYRITGKNTARQSVTSYYKKIPMKN